MIDQRVTEGISSKFFGNNAFTTTIPAQFVKKFNCNIQPVYIERINDVHFKIIFDRQLEFNNEQSIENITERLNRWLEENYEKSRAMDLDTQPLETLIILFFLSFN